MAQMTSEDCYALIAEWRKIAKDNAAMAEQFNRLADQLEAALQAGKASFDMPKKPVNLRPDK